MNHNIAIELISNMALLLAISSIYAILPIKANKYQGLTGVAVGCIIGLAGIGIMTNPFELITGIVFDTRTILISITGLFFGLIPTAVAVVITSLYRILLGGAGALMGVSTILLSACMGLIWRYTRFKKLLKNKKYRVFELYGMGFATHIGMLFCMIFLPSTITSTAIHTISLPVLTLYPIGTVLMGLVFLIQVDREETHTMLQQSEERYRSLFENDHAVMMIIDPKDGDIVDVNPAAVEYYGWSRECLREMNINKINTLSANEIKEEMQKAITQKRNYFNFKHRLASGAIRDVEAFSGPIVVDGQNLLYSIIHDITDRIIAEKKLQESEERLRVTLLSVGDGVITTDEFGRIMMVNKAGEEITGWNLPDIIGQSFNHNFNILNEYTRDVVEDPIQKVLKTGHIIGLANHTVLVRANGTEVPIADSASPILDENGKIQGVVLVIRDVTAEHEKQKEIAYLGYHDSLTGLYNRAFFEEQLKVHDRKDKLPFSILIGDVNGLKMTNDAFGHAMGDRLLKEMANTIKSACREGDIVARWGGDEFIALLVNTDEIEAEKTCARIKAKCATVNMDCIDFSISLGFETKHTKEEEPDNIIKKAEDYMYRKKSIESLSMRGNTINTILSTLHEKSPRERQHSNRVSELCKSIGAAMKMTERELTELCISGLMHDIGKIAVSEYVLNKTGKLTAEEYEEVKRHPEVGYRILRASSNMGYIAEYVLAHHEQLDGSGYPNGLTNEEIPIQSKILAVADSFDAMTSDRPYRKGMSVDAAIEELKRFSGKQFDPEVVNILVECLTEK